MTTLFLSTIGGHLDQLRMLADRIPDDGPAVWVTHDNYQSRAVLRGRDVHYVPYVHEGSVADVARCLPSAHRLWRERAVTRVVSTGSGIALGYLPYLAARGLPCHYVESAARVTAPSRTGRVLERLPGIHRYTQYEHRAGARWLHRGSVFDDYEAAGDRHRPTGAVRVVVTLGTTEKFPFDRLVERLAALLSPHGELARATGLPVDVLWQTGCTRAGHLVGTAVPYLPAETLAAAMSAADLVVSHAGVGSALTALTAGRRPVLVPRSADVDGFADDHQRQVATELQRRGLAVHGDPAALTVGDLMAALSSRVRRTGAPPVFELVR